MNASEPRSLLFLSCDIVGSTKYKQQPGSIWQKTFLAFYYQFPQILGDLTREKDYKPGYELWKPIGDELIFLTPVRSEVDVYKAIRIWLTAMDKFEKNVLSEVALSTKGGAFIATFPGPDSQSSIPRDGTKVVSDKGLVELNDEAILNRSPDFLYDYFGPSIDTGFRVISASTKRYFTLSIEVAWAMSTCRVDGGVDEGKHPLQDLVLLETREFKGVWDGREYPLFALDRHSGDLVNRALAKILRSSVEAHLAASLCKECQSSEKWPSRLYLPDSSHIEFKAEPTDSLEWLRSNNMEGAETVPPPSDAGDAALEPEPPLGDESPSNGDT